MYFQQSKYFEINFNLPGCSEVSLALAVPHWLQLCTMLGSLASKLSGRYDSWPLTVYCSLYCVVSVKHT